MRTITLLLALGVVAGEVRAQARASSPPALIRRAVEAIGGEAALRGLRNKAIEFHSASFGLGQEETPGSPRARRCPMAARPPTTPAGGCWCSRKCGWSPARSTASGRSSAPGWA